MSFLTGLIDAWAFTEGGGATAYGARGALDLQLSRTDKLTTLALSPESGWTNEAYPSTSGRKTYNGAALALFDAGEILPNDGDVLTIAWRFWYGGGQIMDGWPFTGLTPYAHLLGMAGIYTAGYGPVSGLRFYDFQPAGTTPGQLHIQSPSSEVSVSPSDWVVNKGSSPFTPRLLIIEMTRENTPVGGGGPVVTIRYATSGAFKTDTLEYPIDLLDLGRIMFGGHQEIFGSVTQAAIWRRALTGPEVTDLGDDLDDVFTEIADEETPLVTPDGKSRIVFSPDNPRGFAALVVNAIGGASHPSECRATGHTTPRHYTMRVLLGSARELDSLLEAVGTAGSTTPVRMSHPRDDAPTSAADAPLYLITNADAFTINRDTAGARWSADLEIEEVL